MPQDRSCHRPHEINCTEWHRQDQAQVENGAYRVSYSVRKCPVHNCEMVEVSEQKPGSFIPETVTVSSVDLGYQGIGKPRT